MPRKTARPAAHAARPSTYQFTITLRDTQPPIWRRIRVGDGSLDDLHAAIQAAMGWADKHRHYFHIDDRHYGRPDRLADQPFAADVVDSAATSLADILRADRTPLRFAYVYDMGDRWEHDVVFEGCVEAPPIASCIDGGRACPPEDCGGVGGFEYLLEVLGDPDHSEHLDAVESMGNYDPADFDPVWATARMTRSLKTSGLRAS